MSKIIIGHSGGHAVSLDLEVLLRTRLLVQANSGGGKSWLLRRLAEQLFGEIQVIIIDPEGEFATLREKFGYVLVGVGGETPADPRSAGLVAERLLELRAPAVCDLFESFRKNPSGRHLWVKMFLNALLDAPKKLWHPTVIIVDEAHKFCPEGKAGQSEASEAMIGIATAGRKRGFCAVFATQRLSKLRKDTSAELLNRLVGPTFEDLDLERAADLLSVPNSEKKAFCAKMRVLEPGYFFALGRAIAKERILLRVGAVETTHPEIGSTKLPAEPPPPPEKVRALLPRLADLPKEAEEKLRTEADFRAEIRSLKAQLRAQPKQEAQIVDTAAIRDLRAQLREVGKLLRQRESLLQRFQQEAAVLASRAADLAGSEPIRITAGITMSKPLHQEPKREVPRAALPVPARRPDVLQDEIKETSQNNGRLGRAERRVLAVLAQYPSGRTKKQVALLSGYAITGGGFNNALGALRSKGYIGGYDQMVATIEGSTALGSFYPLPTGDELLQHWYRRLGKCQRAILGKLISIYPESSTKEDIGSATGYESSGGGFNNALGRLRTLELISGYNEIKASEELFG